MARRTTKRTTSGKTTAPKSKPSSTSSKPKAAGTASVGSSADPMSPTPQIVAKTPPAPRKQAASARKGGNNAGAATTPTFTTLTHDQIAARAYAIWVAKGKPVGQDEINWRQAEQELLAEAVR